MKSAGHEPGTGVTSTEGPLDPGVRRDDGPRTSDIGRRTFLRILLNTIALDPNRWTDDKIPYFKLIDLLPAVARHGFKDLEIWQFHVDRLTQSELSEVKSRLDSLGTSAPVLGIYPTIHLEGDEAHREQAHAERLLDVAAFLGSDLVKMFVGSVGSGKLDQEACDRSLDFLERLTEAAASRRLRLTGETHANTLFDTVESTLWTLDRLDPDWFGVCFQPYDANLAGAMGAFMAMRNRIWHLHYQGRKGREICLLSEADLDYAEYTRFIAESGFSGYLCIEFVKDCVVPRPEELDVEKVLTNAERDREFIREYLG